MRRLDAGKMFESGMARAEVSRRTGVSWRSVHDWCKVGADGGGDALKGSGRPDPEAKLNDQKAQEVADQLKRGAPAHGYSTELWVLPQVRKELWKLR